MKLATEHNHAILKEQITAWRQSRPSRSWHGFQAQRSDLYTCYDETKNTKHWLVGSWETEGDVEGLTCMTSLRIGVACLKSKRVRDLSLAQVARMSGSAGLKRTAVTVSAPHSKLFTGSDLL